MIPAGSLVLAYGLGVLPFGLWLARRHGVDPTRTGSGSSGATNVGRLLGWRWGLLVAALDLGKGALAVSLAGLARDPVPWLPAALGLLAVVGHCCSPFARWRGGKGAATGAGAALVLAPVAAWISLAVAGVVLLLGRRMAPASLAGVALFPAILYLTDEVTPARLGFALGLLALVFLTHRENLVRLAHGREEALWHWHQHGH